MTPALRAHLEELRAARGDRVSLVEVADVVNSIMSTVTGDLTATDLRLYRELEGLSAYIQRAKIEIAELYPEEIRSEHLPKAADELDAIVKATEIATGAILEAAERIDAAAEKAGLAEARDQVVRIFEACSFQDLTGQRVKKVVATLNHIETRIADLARVFGDEVRKRREELDRRASAKVMTDRDLLQGPQLPGMGNNQDAIDALLASFD
jgi:chemotaxis protein CheZ